MCHVLFINYIAYTQIRRCPDLYAYRSSLSVGTELKRVSEKIAISDDESYWILMHALI